MEMKASTRSNIASNRRTIPRPWLNRKREVVKARTASLDILDKPTWTVSWSKLSACFCIREQTDDQRHNSLRDASLFPTFPAIRLDSSASLGSSPDLEEDVSEDSHVRIYRGLQTTKVCFPHSDVCLFVYLFISFFVSLRADLYRVLRRLTTRRHHSILWVRHTFNLQAPRCRLHDRGHLRQSRLRHLLLRLGNLR
jgi:hypothetical protein